MLTGNHVMALKAVLLRVSFGALLVLLCIRDYLFGNGLFVYRDWTWPLSNRVAPVASFSPKIITTVGPDTLGFARMFMTWPVLAMQALTDSPILAEKAYVLYLFSVMIFLFFVLAELLLQLFIRESEKTISNGSRSAFVLITVLFCVVNFWSLQQLSDLYFPYMIEFALTGISIFLFVMKLIRRAS